MTIKTTYKTETKINAKKLANNKKHYHHALDTTLSINKRAIKWAKDNVKNSKMNKELLHHSKADLQQIKSVFSSVIDANIIEIDNKIAPPMVDSIVKKHCVSELHNKSPI